MIAQSIQMVLYRLSLVKIGGQQWIKIFFCPPLGAGQFKCIVSPFCERFRELCSRRTFQKELLKICIAYLHFCYMVGLISGKCSFILFTAK